MAVTRSDTAQVRVNATITSSVEAEVQEGMARWTYFGLSEEEAAEQVVFHDSEMALSGRHIAANQTVDLSEGLRVYAENIQKQKEILVAVQLKKEKDTWRR